MSPSHKGNKDSCFIMNRGELPNSYGTQPKPSPRATTPARQLSAEAALPLARDRPGIFLTEEKNDVLCLVRRTAKKRFSLRDSSGSHTGGSLLLDKLQREKKKSPLAANDSSSFTATTIRSVSDMSSHHHQQQQARGRRRSSRKSINGLVIEFDLDDESECTMFEQCDDYLDEYKPPLKRETSGGSQEELRTRLEALEHEHSSQELPDHDEIGLGDVCINKSYMEALESSQRTNNSGTRESSSIRTSSFRGIPEHEALVVVGEEDSDCDSSSQSRPPPQRKSTIRSSINGFVLAYDWSSGSDSEGEPDQQQQQEQEQEHDG